MTVPAPLWLTDRPSAVFAAAVIVSALVGCLVGELLRRNDERKLR